MKPRTVEQQKEICRTEWFENHVATEILKCDKIIIINWQNPESWNYGCRFLIHARWLTVVGDIGEAIYEWGQTLTLPFLHRIDFGYFHSKCQASETGRDFRMWDADAANARAQEWLTERTSTDDPHEFKARGHISNISTHTPRDEFEQIVRDAYNDGLDPGECSSLIEGGLVPNCRCIGHFVGLQMAIDQLNNQTVKNTVDKNT